MERVRLDPHTLEIYLAEEPLQHRPLVVACGVAQPDLLVDMVLHSSSEAPRRAQELGSVVHEALSHGVLLDGQP